jgi:hypothetical protein
MPTTLAEMIRVADNYALGDPMQPAIQAEPVQTNHPRQDQHRDKWQDRHNKRREDFPDRRYGPHQVAAVQDNSGADGSHRERTGTPPWVGQNKQWVEKIQWQDQAKYTMESAMDQPCRWHTPNPARPANHLTKDFSWTKRLLEKGNMMDSRESIHSKLGPLRFGAWIWSDHSKPQEEK